MTEPRKTRSTNRGLLEAATASFCFGIVFWGMDRVTPSLGIYWPLFVLRLVTLFGATIIWQTWAKNQPDDTEPTRPQNAAGSRSERPSPVWGMIALVATCDTLAWLSFNAGTRTAYTTIVTALASLFSGVTILLACVFFKEKLSRIQWTGVIAILIGILLVSI